MRCSIWAGMTRRLESERGIEIAKRTGNRRQAAVGRGQIGTVRLFQGRLQDALAAYQQARQTFEDLGEPQSVATAWHQIAGVHEEARQWDRAESAYQHSLRIKVEIGNKSGQATTLHQLGGLYQNWGRLEESVQLYLQAATSCEELGDPLPVNLPQQPGGRSQGSRPPGGGP